MAEQSVVGLARSIALANYIAAHPGCSLAEAARHFGRTAKQIRRDVAVLVDAGFGDLLPGRTLELDIEALSDHGLLSLRSPLKLDQTHLLSESEFSLLLQGLAAAIPSMTSDEQELVPVIATKVAALAGVDKRRISLHLDNLTIPERNEILGFIRRQLDEDLPLHLDYTDAGGQETSRNIWPSGLWYGRDGWLLDALTIPDGFQRSFRIDRITRVAPCNDPEVTKPGTAKPQEEHQTGSNVQVRLSKEAEWLIHELAASTVTANSDGISATFEVWSQEWIRAELLDLAPHIVEITSEDLKQDTAEYARRALEAWMCVERGVRVDD